MALFLSMYLFSVLGFVVHFFSLKKQERTKSKAIEMALLYQLIFSVGMTSLLAFIGLTFMPHYIADYMNWPACPFQQELGNVNLAFGVLGILCIWLRGHFWTATIFGFSIWIFADGIHHIADIIWNRNFSEGSLGVSLYTDLIIPIVLLILLALNKKTALQW